MKERDEKIKLLSKKYTNKILPALKKGIEKKKDHWFWKDGPSCIYVKGIRGKVPVLRVLLLLAGAEPGFEAKRSCDEESCLNPGHWLWRKPGGKRLRKTRSAETSEKLRAAARRRILNSLGVGYRNSKAFKE